MGATTILMAGRRRFTYLSLSADLAVCAKRSGHVAVGVVEVELQIEATAAPGQGCGMFGVTGSVMISRKLA